jgi:hypothetical protein
MLVTCPHCKRALPGTPVTCPFCRAALGAVAAAPEPVRAEAVRPTLRVAAPPLTTMSDAGQLPATGRRPTGPAFDERLPVAPPAVHERQTSASAPPPAGARSPAWTPPPPGSAPVIRISGKAALLIALAAVTLVLLLLREAIP